MPWIAASRSSCARLLGRRLASTDNHSYSRTLLLPKTRFPLRRNPKNDEIWRARAVEEAYSWQYNDPSRTGEPFVLADGPPYANGSIHIGHALNKVLKDIITRYQLLKGKKVNYIPGWDCHGLPIENRTLKDLKSHHEKMDANAIRDAARKTAVQEVDHQREQFKQLGIMANWSEDGCYITLNDDYIMRQLRVFQRMVARGLIYRQYRPVYWSPSSSTALAEAELKYRDDHRSKSVYVKFRTVPESLPCEISSASNFKTPSAVHLLIWTTTPWTLTANMGIAVNPELQYCLAELGNGSNYVVVAEERLPDLGKHIGHAEVLSRFPGSALLNILYQPLFSSDTSENATSLRVIPGNHVTASSGTGLVHCAPAHGAEDYGLFRDLSMLSEENPIVCHVDSRGQFSSTMQSQVPKEFASRLEGKSVLGAGVDAIIDLLLESGHLLTVDSITHKYPYDWKTDKPVIILSTPQWFAKLDSIKANAITALKNVEFVPASSRTRLESFIGGRSEWCISRQRAWGVPIPALFAGETQTAYMDEVTLDHILSVLEEKGVSHWWKGPVEDFVSRGLKDSHPSFVKGTDTMDVWFDSGTSWAALPTRGEGSSRSDVVLEGSDQHRGWFQSLLLTSIGSGENSAPYRTVITHGFTLDQSGKKMSKSMGNVVDPMAIVNGGKDVKKEPAHGADVLRLLIAYTDYQNDVTISNTTIAHAAEAYRKIRNSARFMLGNIRDVEYRDRFALVPRDQLGLMERYIMHKLYCLEKSTSEAYENYNFAKAATEIAKFANVDLSALYLDIMKDCLYTDGHQSARRHAVLTVMSEILRVFKVIVAPILPHLAEEIHAHETGQSETVFRSLWPTLDDHWNDPSAFDEVERLLPIRAQVYKLLEQARMAKQVGGSLEAAVDFVMNPAMGANDAANLEFFTKHVSTLKLLCVVSDVRILLKPGSSREDLTWQYETDECPDALIRLHPALHQKCPRCWMYTRSADDELCGRCASVLGSEDALVKSLEHIGDPK